MKQRTLVCNLSAHVGGEVILQGFVDTVRNQKRMQFLILGERGNCGTAGGVAGVLRGAFLRCGHGLSG